MRPKLVNILEFQKLFPKSAGASHNIFTIKDFTQKISEYFKISKCLQAFPKSAGVPHNLFTIKNFTTKISECFTNSKPLAKSAGASHNLFTTPMSPFTGCYQHLLARLTIFTSSKYILKIVLANAAFHHFRHDQYQLSNYISNPQAV